MPSFDPIGRHPRQRGQALAEFAIALIPLLLLLLGIFDLGRGIYTYNAVSQAAREIARVTSVHPYTVCCSLGTSPEAAQTKATQKAQVPGLTDSNIVIDCVDLADNLIANTVCYPGYFVRVTVRVPYEPVTPLLGLVGPFNLTATSRLQLQ